MKIVGIEALAIPEVKVVRFARFRDGRGYFTESFRKSDIDGCAGLAGLAGVPCVQANESYSRAGTIRGLHFQWNPYMGKLVRTVAGRMIDLVLDVRKGSPTFGKAIACDLPARPGDAEGAWIWVPPGFAHGNCFPEDTVIEYLCTGEYSPGCEAGISPFAGDIDWSLCDAGLKKVFDGLSGPSALVSDKDRAGFTLAAWANDPRSEQFVYEPASPLRVRSAA